jgi:DNA repair protein RecN (Recombination protein N)
VDHHDQLLEKWTNRQQEITVELEVLAAQLTNVRIRMADQLAIQIVDQLSQLQMERTRFVVRIEPSAQMHKNGRDQVEFLISANPGEPLRPLAKVASGGECSRIMLALKSIFARIENIPVLVFDEVDTGVSGRAAQAIAEKMVEVSKFCQVFSITHLPQVACMAHHHFLIEKHVESERTATEVHHLEEPQRIEELARMLGGAVVTDKTRDHARELLVLAHQHNIQANNKTT